MTAGDTFACGVFQDMEVKTSPLDTWCTARTTRLWELYCRREGEKLRFSNHHNQLKCPYIIYADCEAQIGPLEQPIQAGNNTIRDSQNQVCSVAYIVIRSDGTHVKSQLHRGKLPLSS